MSLLIRSILALSLLALTACGGDNVPAPTQTDAVAPGALVGADVPEPDEADDVLFAAVQPAHVVVKEAYVSPATPEDNVDSPTFWLTP
jgi:3-phytase